MPFVEDAPITAAGAAGAAGGRFVPDEPAPASAAPATPPADPPRPATLDVVQNAAYEGAAGAGDTLLNAPNRVMNLGKAGFGSIATALGRPDLAPALTKDPDLIRRGLESAGLIKPGISPQGFQKAIAALVSGGTGGALTGGANLSQVLTGTGMSALSSLAGEGGVALGKKLGLSDSQINALGATLGLAAPGAAAKAGGGLKNVNPDVRKLSDEGVQMTPGQIIGGGTRRVEDSLGSIPFVGDTIKAAQRKGLETFGTAAMNRALTPIGETLPKGLKGSDAVAHVQDTLGKRYDSVLGGMQAHLDAPPNAPQGQPTLRGDLGQILGHAQRLPPERYQELENLVQREVVDEFKGGSADGKTVKNVESLLSKMASDMGISSNYHDRQMAGYVRQVKDAVHDSLYRGGNPPERVKELEAVDTGWANFKRTQRAASSVGADKGVFTPALLHTAVKAGDTSKDKSRFARGDALMQDLTGAGKSVLAQKVPDSGTATRALVEAGAAGTLGSVLSPGLGAAAVTGMAAYSPIAQRAIQQLLLNNRRPTLDNAAQRSAIPLSALLNDNQL